MDSATLDALDPKRKRCAELNACLELSPTSGRFRSSAPIVDSGTKVAAVRDGLVEMAEDDQTMCVTGSITAMGTPPVHLNIRAVTVGATARKELFGITREGLDWFDHNCPQWNGEVEDS